MPEGKRARPAPLPEAIFNYVLIVEEYGFALSEGKILENCERARKSARNYANDFIFRSSVLKFVFYSCLVVKKHV